MHVSRPTLVFTLSANKDLEIELRDVRTAQESKFQTMRALLSSAELKAEGEREERRNIEEQMFRMKVDYDNDYEVPSSHAFEKKHISAHLHLHLSIPSILCPLF